MSASVSDALKALESQIGIPAQQGFAIPANQIAEDPERRKKIISWITIKGVWDVSHNSDETIGKLYGIPRYLETVLDNQKTGKNKYKPRIKSNLNFDAADDDFTSDNFPPKVTIKEENSWGPDDKNLEEYNEELEKSYVSNPNQIKNLVESITKDTIFRSINREIINQRNIQNEENKKFQDSIIKTVHEGVETVLSKALEINRQDAKKIAEEITETKIKSETQVIKGLVEDIVFKSYLNHKIKDQPEEQEFKQESEIFKTKEKDNSFIPKIDPNYHFDPYATKVIRSALSMCENLYVYGDTGCGKTTHLEQVCAVLNRGIIRVNPHDGITREMFLGGMKLINNETIFVPGALPLAMKNGYVFLVDEISFLPPNLTAILNPVGEKNGKLYIPETSEWITPQPGFCIFATDNTGGKGDRTGNYTGTEVQNTATLDRFAFCLKMDYLPFSKEEEMLRKRFPSQNWKEIEKMLRFASEIRSAFSRGELSITFSTRKLIKFFDQRENNFTIQEALSNTIISWLDEDDETLVKTIIDRLDIPNQTIQKSKLDFSKFEKEIRENRFIEAIKELRTIAASKTGFTLELGRAKKLTESYLDGSISLHDLEDQILNGGF